MVPRPTLVMMTKWTLGFFAKICLIIIIIFTVEEALLLRLGVPLVVESYGAWGKEVLESISQLAS